MLTLWKPFNEINRINNEFSQLFRDQWSEPRTTSFAPVVDIEEDEVGITLHADLPGLKEEEIEVQVHEGKLTISGERKLNREKNEKSNYYRERAFGRFSRQFNLGPKLDTSKIEASYSNGVLSVSLPKVPEAKPQQIKISTN